MLIKILLVAYFDKTVGKVLRLIKWSLRQKKSNLIDLLHEESIKTTFIYVKEFLGESLICNSRESLWDYCCEQLPSKKIVLEFGVHKGYSLNYFAKKLPNSIIYGFDSFLGLEQNWYINTAKQGALSLSGKPPKKLFSNVELVIGSFKSTIPDFCMKNPQLQIDLLHIDCDTYSATKLVLASFADSLSPRSIVIFDDFFGYPNW